jgi:L,D-transpeptidase catalytic domain/Putative peptidoglycan binding domain/Sporulation and spore germination
VPPSRSALNRSAAAVAAALCIAALAACGDDGDGDSAGAGEEATGPEAAAPELPSSERADTAKVWFTSGEQFRTAQRELPESGSALEPAVEELLAGPTVAEATADAEAQTQIPEGTELERVKLAPDGTATVELSDRFLAGIPDQPDERGPGERQELSARVGQVTYTLTQFREVSAAKVIAGGEVVDAEVSRSDYAAPAQGPQPVRKPPGAKLPGTRAVQTRLAQLGYLPKGAVDGVAGYQTQQAVIAFQSWEGLARDGVVGPATSAGLESARRPKPRRGGPRERIEVHRAQGVTLLVKGGRTKRAIHTSSGAPGTETPAGRYEVFRKELRSWSVPFSTWLPYASYFNHGIAFHEYPDVPAYPASHGCVRVPAPDAPLLYRFAAIGTTVVVF